MSAVEAIPVVDFSNILAADSADIKNCVEIKELRQAIRTVGFVFLKGHGIDRKIVDDVFSTSVDFFTLPEEDKKRYWRPGGKSNHGYTCMEQERINPTQPGDLKESYDMCEKGLDDPVEIKQSVSELYDAFNLLTKKILESFGHMLDLDDPQFFMKAHNKIGLGYRENYTALRTLYYPSLPASMGVKKGQLRCGEHVDYGSMTLLFQDENGGLQVKTRDGGYIDVPYMPEAVLLNGGALMQQWTGDRIYAAPHRVLVPDDEAIKGRVRQSVAFFVHPDNEVLVETIDGSNKYAPVTAQEDTEKRFLYSYDIEICEKQTDYM